MYSFPLPQQIMSRRRFLQISNALHLSDINLDAIYTSVPRHSGWKNTALVSIQQNTVGALINELTHSKSNQEIELNWKNPTGNRILIQLEFQEVELNSIKFCAIPCCIGLVK